LADKTSVTDQLDSETNKRQRVSSLDESLEHDEKSQKMLRREEDGSQLKQRESIPPSENSRFRDENVNRDRRASSDKDNFSSRRTERSMEYDHDRLV